jgi:hypothetical protein
VSGDEPRIHGDERRRRCEQRLCTERGTSGWRRLRTRNWSSQLEENLAAADLELTATDLKEIETASAAITVQGARYPEAMERLIDR